MKNQNERAAEISKQALSRMPYYLEYLKRLKLQGVQTVSAPLIASELKLSGIQVRKDLAAVSETGGRPKTGFSVDELLHSMEAFLGYDNVNEAVLVGAGHLGRALLSYKGFEKYGLNIAAAFDVDNSIVGTQIAGKTVFHLTKLSSVCRYLKVKIGIIAVPDRQAQAVCDMMIQSGIMAIWNFAPIHLSVDGHILVLNENMASSLAQLSKHLEKKLHEDA